MINSKQLIAEYGKKRWRNLKGQLHRENGPAVIWIDGEMHWRINGISHRIDGPAIIFKGYRAWNINNEFIREFEYD